MSSDDGGTAGPAYRALAERLRSLIVSGELKPGDRLPIEPELSSQYGVSRSTVREALRLLTSQNLVTTTRGVTGGSFVAHPRPDQISDSLEIGLNLLSETSQTSVDQLLEVRELLEVPVAGFAATRRTTEQLGQLHATLFDPDSVDPADIFEPNNHFHAVLLRAADNPFIEVVNWPISRVLGVRFAREDAPSRFWHRVDADHRAILTAVEDGDADAARAAMRTHLNHLRVTYTRIDRERAELR